jgi:hypothetical protein
MDAMKRRETLRSKTFAPSQGLSQIRPSSIVKRLGALTIAATLAVGLVGCGSFQKSSKLTPPTPVIAPYDTSSGEVLFAVLPLKNESGTSQSDPAVTSDKLIAALAEVRGIKTLPLNRTIEAMRVSKIPSITKPADARRLAEALGADAVIVGSVTAYDPYTPTLGLSLALYGRSGAVLGHAVAETPAIPDPKQLRTMPSEPIAAPASGFGGDRPTNTISDHMDGKNHEVLLDVQRYATGRTMKPSALDWRRFTKSMELYEEFCAHRVVERLMASERLRLGIPQDPTTDSGRKAR